MTVGKHFREREPALRICLCASLRTAVRVEDNPGSGRIPRDHVEASVAPLSGLREGRLDAGMKRTPWCSVTLNTGYTIGSHGRKRPQAPKRGSLGEQPADSSGVVADRDDGLRESSEPLARHMKLAPPGTCAALQLDTQRRARRRLLRVRGGRLAGGSLLVLRLHPRRQRCRGRWLGPLPIRSTASVCRRRELLGGSSQAYTQRFPSESRRRKSS